MTSAKSRDLRVTNHDYEWSPKYYGVVATLFASMYMCTLALAGRLFTVGVFALSTALLVFPVCTITSDVLTELYGFRRTRQVIWGTLFCAVLFSFFSTIAISLPAPSFATNTQAYTAVFASTWRMTIGGCAAWVVGELSNSLIMSKLKIFQNAKHMSLRFIASTVIAQLFDSLTIGLIAFLGTMPFNDFLIMMFISWAVKVLYEVVLLPLSVPLTKWLKTKEGVEHFDRQKIGLV